MAGCSVDEGYVVLVLVAVVLVVVITVVVYLMVVMSLSGVVNAGKEVSDLVRADVLVPVLQNLTSCWSRTKMRVMRTMSSTCVCLLLQGCARHPVRLWTPGAALMARLVTPGEVVSSMVTTILMAHQVCRIVHRFASTEHFAPRQVLVDHPDRCTVVLAYQQ